MGEYKMHPIRDPEIPIEERAILANIETYLEDLSASEREAAARKIHETGTRRRITSEKGKAYYKFLITTSIGLPIGCLPERD